MPSSSQPIVRRSRFEAVRPWRTRWTRVIRRCYRSHEPAVPLRQTAAGPAGSRAPTPLGDWRNDWRKVGDTIMGRVSAFVPEHCGRRARASIRSDADFGSGAGSADRRSAAARPSAVALPWVRQRTAMRQVHGPRPRLARGERRPQLCRSVAGDGVEAQRQQPRKQRGVVDGAGTDAEPGRSQGPDERGREEEVLDADAVQPGCLRPSWRARRCGSRR